MPAREAVIGDTLTRLIALDGPTLKRLPVARAVLEGPAYRGLLNYVGSFRRRPSLYVQTVFSQFAPDAEPDIQSFFHTDTFHPTVKAWFFLQDVEQDAAPFAYVPGSHRANRRKLAWERRVSVTAHGAGDRLTAEGSFRITEDEIRRLGYAEPRRMPVAANTLVVADTSGIHRRSTTDKPSVRVSIWAYSRSNPFLPWVGGDPVALPLVKDHAQRLYWWASDRLKDKRGSRGCGAGWATGRRCRRRCRSRYSRRASEHRQPPQRFDAGLPKVGWANSWPWPGPPSWIMMVFASRPRWTGFKDDSRSVSRAWSAVFTTAIYCVVLFSPGGAYLCRKAPRLFAPFRSIMAAMAVSPVAMFGKTAKLPSMPMAPDCFARLRPLDPGKRRLPGLFDRYGRSPCRVIMLPSW